MNHETQIYNPASSNAHNNGLADWPQLEKSLARLAKAHINSLKPVSASTLLAWTSDLYSQLYCNDSDDDVESSNSQEYSYNDYEPDMDLDSDGVFDGFEDSRSKSQLLSLPHKRHFNPFGTLSLRRKDWGHEEYLDYISDQDPAIDLLKTSEEDCDVDLSLNTPVCKRAVVSNAAETPQVTTTTTTSTTTSEYPMPSLDAHDIHDIQEASAVSRNASEDEMYSNAFSNGSNSTQCTSILDDDLVSNDNNNTLNSLTGQPCHTNHNDDENEHQQEQEQEQEQNHQFQEPLQINFFPKRIPTQSSIKISKTVRFQTNPQDTRLMNLNVNPKGIAKIPVFTKEMIETFAVMNGVNLSL